MQALFVSRGYRRGKKALFCLQGMEEASAGGLISLQERKKNNGNVSHYFTVTFLGFFSLQDESIMLSLSGMVIL